MKTVTLAVPTLRRYDLLTHLLVASAERGTRKPDQYFVVDNGGGLDAVAYGLPTEKTTIYKPGRNLGVSASWNHAIRERLPSDDDGYLIMACDDMDLYANTVEALVAAADAHPEVGFFYPEHNAHTMFGVYLQRRWCWDKIGPYDERFWPAYFEDNDYCYRLKLAGVPLMTVPGCGNNHVGSATMATYNEDEMREHHARFDGCRNYYIQKWGGPPHGERFSTPFNGAQ
jgi:GT2 family glycosyltransferase